MKVFAAWSHESVTPTFLFAKVIILFVTPKCFNEFNTILTYTYAYGTFKSTNKKVYLSSQTDTLDSLTDSAKFILIS